MLSGWRVQGNSQWTHCLGAVPRTRVQSVPGKDSASTSGITFCCYSFPLDGCADPVFPQPHPTLLLMVVPSVAIGALLYLSLFFVCLLVCF